MKAFIGSSLFLLFTLLLGACGSSEGIHDAANLEGIEASVKIVRLEQDLRKLKSRAEIEDFLKKHPDFSEKYMRRSQLPHDSIAVDQLYQMLNEPALDTLFDDVAKKYGNIDDIQAEFEDAFRHIKYYYPEFKEPKIYTTITGLGSFYGTDLFVSDDMIVISLDFFMGSEARYRPPVEMIPDYIWHRFHKKSIVPTVVMYLSNKYNKTNFEDKTALAEMIYHGKAYHFTKTMMPTIADSILFGYTSTELANIEDEKNREYIWGHLIEKEVLFSTNQKVIASYLEEHPFVAEINKKCPGRIGRWLGYRIVQKYLSRNSEVTFQQLMANQDARNIFNLSGYNGD